MQHFHKCFAVRPINEFNVSHFGKWNSHTDGRQVEVVCLDVHKIRTGFTYQDILFKNPIWQVFHIASKNHYLARTKNANKWCRLKWKLRKEHQNYNYIPFFCRRNCYFETCRLYFISSGDFFCSHFSNLHFSRDFYFFKVLILILTRAVQLRSTVIRSWTALILTGFWWKQNRSKSNPSLR